jgi:hypothetical protein
MHSVMTAQTKPATGYLLWLVWLRLKMYGNRWKKHGLSVLGVSPFMLLTVIVIVEITPIFRIPKTRPLYKDLTILLAQSGTWGFGSVVDLAGHREFFPNVQEEMSYHFCIVRVINFFLKFAHDQNAEQLKISLDNRIDVKFNAAYLYSLLIKD